MNLSRMLRRGLSMTVLMTALLFLVGACNGEETTPTPVPTPTLSELLSNAGEKMGAMSTAKFSMADENESGAKFFGTTFKSLEAEVKAPDSFRMIVDVVAPGFGFVQIEMMAVGDQAFMKLSKDAPWASLPLDQVPFNFAGLGTTLQNLLTRIEDGTITGPESMLDIQAYRVETSITSEELSDLITSVDSGHTVNLTLWIDEAEHALRQIKIDGQLYDDDAPETVRLVIIEAVDIPVEIELPDIGS